jgi:pimeloyl-ACP methyl ester carboxylesterase
MSKKIIIGIHGLHNKPPYRLLKTWWKRALKEGLLHNPGHWTFFPLEMVYWADVLYASPLDPNLMDETDPLFVKYPYCPGTDFSTHPPNRWRQRALDGLEKLADRLFLTEDMTAKLESLSNLVIRTYFRDLDCYYSDQPYRGQKTVRDEIRDRLLQHLLQHRNKDILLLAHSMGSLIAYDVLITYQDTVKIDTLVTVGSPLGQPAIIARMVKDHFDQDRPSRLPTPDNIRTAWYNIADLKDRVALNYTLNDDFSPNQDGITPQDIIVRNTYRVGGKSNPHTVYGYIRTPECSQRIYTFLKTGRSRARQWFEHHITPVLCLLQGTRSLREWLLKLKQLWRKAE